MGAVSNRDPLGKSTRLMTGAKPFKFAQKGYHKLRLGRWSSPGYIYFLITRTANQRSVFKDKECCQIVFEAIKWLEDQKRWECYCVMIMPDHVHIVITIERGYKLSQLMHSWKRYSAKKINGLRGETGKLWQDGYYDHCIRKEEVLRDVILYCYQNPVRKGLVQKASEYPFWKCKFQI